MSFTTETGAAILGREFSSVTLHAHDVSLSIPSAQPVIAYIGSIREPTVARIRGQFDFDVVLADIAGKVELVIQAEGSFRATSRSGVFICR